MCTNISILKKNYFVFLYYFYLHHNIKIILVEKSFKKWEKKKDKNYGNVINYILKIMLNIVYDWKKKNLIKY